MRFIDLHDDIVWALIEVIPDRTLVNLSCSCHRLHTLCQSRLRRRKYNQLYRPLRLASQVHLNSSHDHPVHILYNVLQDPDIIDYVEEIHFSPQYCSQSYSGWPEEACTALLERLEACDYFKEQIFGLTALNQVEADAWLEAVKGGDFDPVFLVLLSLCKKTGTLKLYNTYNLPRFFSEGVLQQMQANHAEPEVPNGMTDSMTEPLSTFPCIRSLELSDIHPDAWLEYEAVYDIIQMPTLEELTVRRLGYHACYDDWIWPEGKAESCTLKHVELLDSSFSPEALVEFIRGLPQLRLLTYQNQANFCNGLLGWGYKTADAYAKCLLVADHVLFNLRSLEVSTLKDSTTNRWVVIVAKVQRDGYAEEIADRNS